MKRKTLAWFGLLYVTVFVVVVLAASGRGFITYSPDARYGSGSASGAAGIVFANKWTASSGGATLEISEIGVYVQNQSAGVVGHAHLAIFEHDAANDCPGTMVANSESSELTAGDSYGTYPKKHTYTTKPTITAGNTYWLGIIVGDNSLYISRESTGGASVYKTGLTYPTWPTDTAWHTHTDGTNDLSIYAVYAEQATTTTTSTSTTSTTSTTTSTAAGTTTTVRRSRMLTMGVG